MRISDWSSDVCSSDLFTQHLEEGSDVFASTAAADPEHAFAGRVDDHRGVAMAFLDSEFVHPQDLDAGQIDGTQLLLQSGAVDVLDGLPVQAEELCDMPDRGDRKSTRLNSSH